MLEYASKPESRPNVGSAARQGFLWLMTQTLVGKVANSLVTFVAAWFLLPDDYKLVALAFPITQFITVMQQLGVDKVLIARSGDFERWCNPGFWMSSAAGLASGLLIVAAAPLAARVYDQHTLMPLLLLLAIAAPLNGITTVHQAWLQIHFRFRLIALMNIVSLTLQGGLTIVMAWHHYGPYALIVPIMAAAFFRFAIYWAMVRVPVKFKPEFHQWRHIIADSFGAFGTQFNQLVVAQGDYLLLGLLLPRESMVLGYFVFAFSLSASILASLVVNLQSTWRASALVAWAHAVSSALRTSSSAMRRPRHCLVRQDSSISAMLSHDPCLGVWWISNLPARAYALSGGNAS